MGDHKEGSHAASICEVSSMAKKQMNIRIEESISDRLNDYCEKSGQTKTVAIERALTMFMDNYDERERLLKDLEKK